MGTFIKIIACTCIFTSALLLSNIVSSEWVFWFGWTGGILCTVTENMINKLTKNEN